MVVTDTCAICRKPILRTQTSVVRARVRGLPDDVVAVFHEGCYPGDEGTVFERIDGEDSASD